MAARPVILTVDDDPEVLLAIERDLQRQYGKEYRVLRADSGKRALDLLDRLKLRNDPVALLLVDERMPEMTGVEFLEKAMDVVPGAKRALLTAYADTDAAIRAINRVQIHYYLMKPWDPPEQHLYPVLRDLLADWQASHRPTFEGIRLLGHRWSPDAHRIRDFLGRNMVPFQWLDLDVSEEGKKLMATLAERGESPSPPVVLMKDDDYLMNPDLSTLAARIDMRVSAEQDFYDLVVVGAGPAGLAAAVYGASDGLKTLLVEREAPGGQAGTSSNIENYLGFPEGISGSDLTRRATRQATKFGVETLTPQEVKAVRLEGPYRVLTLGDGKRVSTKALLISTGVSYRTLDVPGVERLTGRGIYYGAATLTEALSCRDEEVYIVGGGNSAGQAAVNFAQYARHVRIMVRGPGLSDMMSKYLVDQIMATPNIEVMPRTQVVEAGGDDHLEWLTLVCGEKDSKVRETVPATSLFVFIGASPRTDWLGGLLTRDEFGFIVTGPDLPREQGRVVGWPLERDPFLLETSLPGVMCAGDVRHQSVKRVASAAGEGAIAVQFTHRFLAES